MAHRTLDERLSRLSDRGLFFVTLWGEARGEPIEGQVAAAMVIQNRLKSGKWFGGDSYSEVLSRWAQFSALWPTLSSAVGYSEVLDMAGVYYRGERVEGPRDALVRQLLYVVDGVMGERIIDNTYGATHYYAPRVVGRPNWAVAPGRKTVTIGRHDFWAGVS